MPIHNPDNVPSPGPGYRFLDEDEIIDCYATDELEVWDDSGWIGGKWDGRNKFLTYRTMLSKEELKELRGLAPKLGLPSSPMQIDPTSRPRPNVYIYRPRATLAGLALLALAELALLLYIAFK